MFSVFRVYLITDRHAVLGGDLIRAVASALSVAPPGSVAVQLRERDLPSRELLALAQKLRSLTREMGAPLLINDRVDVALAVDADGVHLPENGLPIDEVRRLLGNNKMIGASTHAPQAVTAAVQAGADFVVFGPVFATPSKEAYGPPQGLSALGAACWAAGNTPLFAVGGIEPSRVGSCLRAGATGIAVIRSGLGSPDPAQAMSALLAALEENH